MSFLHIFLSFREENRMLESKFKSDLIKEIEMMFLGCIVLHNDANEIQGIPDLIILYKDKWAALEGKKTKNSKHQPNQDYYIGLMDEMSYASFVYPENKKEVLNELQYALELRR